MARRDRSRSFLFEPNRYRFDPAVLGMSVLARGAYSILWCAAWDMPEPGVIEPATPAVLASLAMVDSDTWEMVVAEVERAFDTATPGKWIQRGLRRTLEAQDAFIESQRERGRRGGLAKAASGAKMRKSRNDNNKDKDDNATASGPLADPKRTPSQPPSKPVAPSVLGSRFLKEKDSGPACLPEGQPPRAGAREAPPHGPTPAPRLPATPAGSFASRPEPHGNGPPPPGPLAGLVGDVLTRAARDSGLDPRGAV